MAALSSFPLCLWYLKVFLGGRVVVIGDDGGVVESERCLSVCGDGDELVGVLWSV